MHLHCIGYIEDNGERLPDTYACSGCLRTGETDHVGQLQKHAVLRRALWWLKQQSFEDNRSFGHALGESTQLSHILMMLTSSGFDDKVVADVKKELSQCGLIVAGRGASRQRISLIRSPAAEGMMRQKFFQPTYGIAHHVRSHYVRTYHGSYV